eukprot:gnl/MRDRNA2_/MRDRNA2_96196_c0_seq1.p1 gnl/MRDRNA2_/MRDRNA2_96196_c0~~gnl/MRDRNA2_/MRDRNA2_96196_c0_seq1.p1  ORF type:complete len:2418 (+),score=411.56 gnl/MRDRNA2_/MRDRNA2_96196_c0_seq1:103-7356(+)
MGGQSCAEVGNHPPSSGQAFLTNGARQHVPRTPTTLHPPHAVQASATQQSTYGTDSWATSLRSTRITGRSQASPSIDDQRVAYTRENGRSASCATDPLGNIPLSSSLSAGGSCGPQGTTDKPPPKSCNTTACMDSSSSLAFSSVGLQAVAPHVPQKKSDATAPTKCSGSVAAQKVEKPSTSSPQAYPQAIPVYPYLLPSGGEPQAIISSPSCPDAPRIGHPVDSGMGSKDRQVGNGAVSKEAVICGTCGNLELAIVDLAQIRFVQNKSIGRGLAVEPSLLRNCDRMDHPKANKFKTGKLQCAACHLNLGNIQNNVSKNGHWKGRDISLLKFDNVRFVVDGIAHPVKLKAEDLAACIGSAELSTVTAAIVQRALASKESTPAIKERAGKGSHSSPSMQHTSYPLTMDDQKDDQHEEDKEEDAKAKGKASGKSKVKVEAKWVKKEDQEKISKHVGREEEAKVKGNCCKGTGKGNGKDNGKTEPHKVFEPISPQPTAQTQVVAPPSRPIAQQPVPQPQVIAPPVPLKKSKSEVTSVSSSPSLTSPPKTEDLSAFAIGVKVSVCWKGSWYHGKVIEVSKRKKVAQAPVKVHYLGFNASMDEWVGLERLKLLEIKEEEQIADDVSHKEGWQEVHGKGSRKEKQKDKTKEKAIADNEEDQKKNFIGPEEVAVVQKIVRGQKAGYVLRLGGDSIFKPDFIFENWPLRPRIGDCLSLSVAPRLVEAAKMSFEDVLDFLHGFQEQCRQSIPNACSDLVANCYQYMLGTFQCDLSNSPELAHKLLSILLCLVEDASESECPQGRILLDAAKSPFVRKCLPHLLAEGMLEVEQCETFCELLTCLMPHALCFTKSLLHEVLVCRDTGHSSAVQSLWRILDAVGDSFAKTTGYHDAVSWRRLSVVPHLLSTDLSSVQDLPVVKTKYDSTDEYLDTMFRLLRANCFMKLQECISDFVVGKLDHRDMKVYTAKISGLALLSRTEGFVLTLQCEAIRGYLGPRALIFGSLVCLSLSTPEFESVAWGKVVERPTPKKKTKTVDVVLQFPDELNRVHGTELLFVLLQTMGRKLIMAESPVYFQAYSAVFKVLQTLKPDNLPLGEAFLGQTPLAFLPDVPWAHCAQEHFKNVIQERMDSDPSQCRAMTKMLQKPLTTIQGPPGTGKTFLGLRAVEAFLYVSRAGMMPAIHIPHSMDEFARHDRRSYQKELWEGSDDSVSDLYSEQLSSDEKSEMSETSISTRSPILVLFYKNHAGDEFLLAAKRELTNNIIRIGGRGADELKEFNLNTLAREKPKDKALGRALHQAIQRKKQVEQSIRKVMEKLCKATDPQRLFLEKASHDQLLSLVEHCPGKHHKHNCIKQALESGSRDELSQEDIAPFYKLWMDYKASAVCSRATEVGMAPEDEEAEEADSADEEQQERKRHEDAVETLPLPLPSWAEFAGASASNNVDVLYCLNVWTLTPADKACLMRTWLAAETSRWRPVLDRLVCEHKFLLSRIASMERRHKVAILQEAEIVGATITGASIHVEMLREVGFRICVIEEAAEILEPLTLAAIPPSVKQLILIGDHYQLKPVLENEELARVSNLDISMMERFIKANDGKPSAQLTLQNRMRPEMVKLINDIYPKLGTNEDRTRKHLPVPGFGKAAMFFKDTTGHASEMSKEGRSQCNPGEASEIVELIAFLCFEGLKEEQITALAMYKGQRHLLIRMLASKGFGAVRVDTVDQYQGDQNDVVIVSLTRSDHSTRFVDTRNRRCVAASRAHRLVVFFGAVPMLRKNAKAWRHVITSLDAQGLVGPNLPLECPRHPGVQLALGERCQHICSAVLACGHICHKPCHSSGSHPRCEEIVADKFPRCGHDVCRPCWQPIEELNCKQVCKFVHQECGHEGTRLCHQAIPKCRAQAHVTCHRCGRTGVAECARHREKPDEYVCKHICTRKMRCGHPCKLKCGANCDDGLDDCEVCAAERSKEAERRKAEIEEEIEKLSRDNGVHFNEVMGSEFDDIHRHVAAYYAESHLEPRIIRATKVSNTKLEKQFLISSHRCQNPTEIRQLLIKVASEDEAKDAAQKGLGNLRSFKKGVNIYQYVQVSESTPSECVFLLCKVQTGRVYEHGVRNHRIPFGQVPAEFDSGYDEVNKCYRLQVATRALPLYIVHVKANAKRGTLPQHWTLGDMPVQGWSAVSLKWSEDEQTLRALRDSLDTDGTQLSIGRDVHERGDYSRLELALAWRIEHPHLWSLYEVDRDEIAERIKKQRLACPRIRIRKKMHNATRMLPDKVRDDVNEVRLLHGSKAENLLPILNNGLNERFSGGMFGHGSYLAEDAGKNDQYVERDRHYGQVPDLHERLYRDGVKHPGDVYYLLLCRTVLGCFVCTQDGVTVMNGRGPIFANSQKRELAAMPDVTPPLPYHSLVAETGRLRYREFIQFHGTRVYPEYLIAYKRK